MLPHASLRLKQGFGRLIRTGDRSRRGGDRAIRAIVTKRYGRGLLEALPPARRVIGTWSEVVERGAGVLRGRSRAERAPASRRARAARWLAGARDQRARRVRRVTLPSRHAQTLPVEDRLRGPQLRRPRQGARQRGPDGAAHLPQAAVEPHRERGIHPSATRCPRRWSTRGRSASSSATRLRKATAAEARRAVAGIVAANDVTARDLQKSDSQWTRAKGFDTFCAVGEVGDGAGRPRRAHGRRPA